MPLGAVSAQSGQTSRRMDCDHWKPPPRTVAKAIDYMFTRWSSFVRLPEDDRIALCSPALGRKSWLFPESERGADRAALMYTLIGPASSTPSVQPWLANVLARIADQPAHRLDELLPWNGAVARQRRNFMA